MTAPALAPETLKDLLRQAFEHPTDRGVEGPYQYQWDATSEPWKRLCSMLPCFDDLAWPDYDTKCWYEYELFGQPVVIQLWKGLCQQFLGRTDFPGGIGGEVGIYMRAPGRALPPLDFLPLPLQGVYRIATRLAGENLWWPVPEHLQPRITFRFKNPKTGQRLFEDPQSEKTYWLTKWMEFDSFRDYEQKNPTPTWATEFEMSAVIEDDTQTIILDW